MLLPPSNDIFVPASEPLNPVYAWRYVALALRTLFKQSIFEPGQPQSENTFGFLRRLFDMIFEITTVLFVVQGVSVLG
jgi:hypothetical protein